MDQKKSVSIFATPIFGKGLNMLNNRQSNQKDHLMRRQKVVSEGAC